MRINIKPIINIKHAFSMWLRVSCAKNWMPQYITNKYSKLFLLFCFHRRSANARNSGRLATTTELKKFARTAQTAMYDNQKRIWTGTYIIVSVINECATYAELIIRCCNFGTPHPIFLWWFADHQINWT